MMNRENEEQKPVPQTLCGALQKEANCKCLVLSVLIYGCLAAVTWCRCANVTKVAFMGMLYLVYLVECYHSPIRIDLLHAEGQSGVLAKLTQLRMAQPTIWWKAISYHYVRRKRQVMRYRNGDNFTTTQVYYERVNSHAATSFYFYDYCGSKDISKELILDPKIPITKITLSKGFAFSNVRSATEFEEARSRFFAEQEFRDDYMEMREGLDLGCNFSPMTLVAVLGNPWFTRSYVYWCLSALLLSWPLRIIIECNTQYVNYQVTKLFGVNYDTPTNIQIHTSASQLSAPGSYMLAPSYSEALLMEPMVQPAAPPEPDPITDMVPSYSEALLYERANEEHQPVNLRPVHYQREPTGVCECPCHGLVEHPTRIDGDEFASQDSLQINDTWSGAATTREDGEGAAAAVAASVPGTSGTQTMQRVRQSSIDLERLSIDCVRICDSCLNDAATERRGISSSRRNTNLDAAEVVEPRQQAHRAAILDGRRCILREYSEPDLRRSSEILGDGATNFLRANGRSLENILESEEIASENPLHLRATSERAEALVLNESSSQQHTRNTGAIPKRTQPEGSKASSSSSSSSSRVMVNPIAEAVKRLPSSRSTYFCLKSILKQNRRRFTLVTAEELQSLTHEGLARADEECTCDGCRTERERPDSLRIDKQRPLSCQSLSYRRENSRTLIFASPIQVVCPSDPFGGRNVVQSDNPPEYEDALNLPVLSRLRRSRTERDAVDLGATASSSSSSSSSASTSAVKASRAWKHRRTLSTDPQHFASLSNDNTRTALITSTQTGQSETAISLPSYDGLVVPPDLHNSGSQAPTDELSPFLRFDELTAAAAEGTSTGSDAAVGLGETMVPVKTRSRLTRSLTERRSAPESRRHDRMLRKSFIESVDTGCRIAGVRRSNINIETSL